MQLLPCRVPRVAPSAYSLLGNGPQESAAIYAGDASGRAFSYQNFMLNATLVSSFSACKARNFSS